MKFQFDNIEDLRYKGGHKIPNLHLLKTIGVIFIVAIHVPILFPRWIEGVTRYAVPIFFMITGYFLVDSRGRISLQRVRKDIIKIIKIDIVIQLLYICYHLIKSIFVPDYFSEQFLSPKHWLDFILFGRFFGYQLWYLHALVLSLLVVYVLTYIRNERFLYVMAFVGPIINLLLGSYFFLFSDNELSCMASRNFLTVGIPCIAAGIWIRRNESRLWNVSRLWALFSLLLVLSLAESMLICDVKSVGDIMIFTLPASIVLFCIALKSTQISESNFLANFGKYHSMNMYLFHVMIIFALSDIGFTWLGYESINYWKFPLTLLLTWMVSVGIVRTSRARVRIASAD